MRWVLLPAARLLLLLLGVLLASHARADPLAEPLQWVPPAALRLLSSDGQSLSAPLPPGGPWPVRQSEIVLIPARRGDQLALSGVEVAAGIATGTVGTRPDAIVWHHPKAPEQLRVGHWTSVRFVALRALQTGTLQVRIARAARDSLTAYRNSQHVHRWLHADKQHSTPLTAPLQEHSNASARRDASTVSALAHWLQQAETTRSRTAPRGISPLGARWLQAQWLERSLEHRPLRSPFFFAQRVWPPAQPELLGSWVNQWFADEEEGFVQRSSPEDDSNAEDDDSPPDTAQPLDATAYEPLSVHSPTVLATAPFEVMRVSLQALSVGRSVVEVYSGPERVQTLDFRVARRSENTDRWTAARTIRVVTHGQSLTLKLLQGAIRARVTGYAARHGVLDVAEAHSLRALHSRPITAPHPWTLGLWEFSREPVGTTRQKLVDHWNALAPERDDSSASRAALLVFTVLPSSPEMQHSRRAWRLLWQATSTLPPDWRDALRLDVLQRTLRRAPTALPSELNPEASQARGGATLASPSLTEALVQVALETLFTPTDRGVPYSLWTADRLAGQFPADAQAHRLIRRGWSRATPWAALSPLNATPVLQIRTLSEQPGPSGLCSTRGDRGVRWWVVPAREQSLSIEGLGGTHSALLFRPLHSGQLQSSQVQISGTPVHVHPLLGEPSRVAVRPGLHSLQWVDGPPVVARLPGDHQLPCSALREGELWTPLHQQLHFALPGEAHSTIASVIVQPDPRRHGPTRLTVEVGDHSVEADFYPSATGDISVVVPPYATSLTIRSETAALVRARLRLHPRRLPRPDPTNWALQSPPHPADETVKLIELRKLTSEWSQAHSPASQANLLLGRGDILMALGFRNLAYGQWSRGGANPELRDTSRPGALFLPHRPEEVLALGLSAQAPTLALAPSQQLLTRAAQLQEAGQRQQALTLLLATPPGRRSPAATLLTAHLATRLQKPMTAGAAFEQLAQHTAAPIFSLAAAEQYDLLARQQGRLDYARRALALAHSAPPDEALARSLLSGYRADIQWQTPSLSMLGQRPRTITSTRLPAAPESLSQSTKRALILAPPNARLLHSSTRVSLARHRGRTLQFTGLCFARQGDSEQCSLTLTVDGSSVPCPPRPSQGNPNAATPQHCPVAIAANAQTLNIGVPEPSEPLAWVQLRDGQQLAGDSLQQSTRYAHLTQHTTGQFELDGPIALRLRVRSMAPAGAPRGQLQLRSHSLRDDTATAPKPFELSAPMDPTAQYRKLPTAVGLEERFEYTLLAAGRHRISLRAVGAALLVRPEVAVLQSAPLHTTPQAPDLAPHLDRPSSAQTVPLAVVPLPPQHLPYPVRVTASIQDRDLSDSDNDQRDRYLQVTASTDQQWSNHSLWLSSQAFARVRQGSGTLGLFQSAQTRLGPQGLTASAALRAAYQPALAAAGLNAQMAVAYRSAAIAQWPLTFRAQATVRTAARSLRDARGIDALLYSNYAYRRPRSWDLQLRTLHRPYSDTTVSYSVGLRLDPNFHSVDRAVAGLTVNSLPGSGWAPWLRVNLQVGYRPPSAYRNIGFVRWQLSPRATFWRWRSTDERWRSQLSASLFVDAPGTAKGVFLQLSGDFERWTGRGLGDRWPLALPFAERLAEGGPLPTPTAAGSDAAWLQEAAP